MFSEVKLNFTQPGKDQWRAHSAETEVRLSRALSHISRSSPVCGLAEVGTRWKERRQNGERGDDRQTTPIHSSWDAFSHLFGISVVVFLWASLRDIQARWDPALERPGRRVYQEGTLDTCGKVWLYKLKGWMSLQRNADYPDPIAKSVGSLGFCFLSQAEGIFAVAWTPDPNICRYLSGCLLLLPRSYYFLRSGSSIENRT